MKSIEKIIIFVFILNVQSHLFRMSDMTTIITTRSIFNLEK